MDDFNTNPSLKLSSVLLNEHNYVLWSRAVTLFLGGKKKMGFINGKIVCPLHVSKSKAHTTTTEGATVTTTDSNDDDRQSNDQLDRFWLLNFMEPHSVCIFTFSDSSK